MPPKLTHKATKPVDPATLRRSTRGQVPTSPDQSSAEETLVEVVFDESNPSFLQHNGYNSQLNEFERLLEAGASGGTSPLLQPFNITEALTEFSARSRSPSVIVVPDTGSDTSTLGSGYV